MPTTYDCHPTQKTYDENEISSHHPQKGSSQTSHYRISSGHSNKLNMPPKILFLFSNSMEGHRKPYLPHGNLSEMLVPYLERLSSMQDAQLVWKSSCTMECSLVLSIWEHLLLVQNLCVIELVLLDNLDCLVKGHGFNNLNSK
jgi:hypothetical protein